MTPIQDFTVGNTITIAVAIYKQNWKRFIKLSLIAHLWLLVPVYGWARYFAIAAWISKLSFDQLSPDFEHLKRRQYFKINSLFFLLIIGISSIFIPLILGNIIMLPLSIIAPAILKLVVQMPNGWEFIEQNFMLLGYIASLMLFLIWSLIYTRLFITDLTYGSYLRYPSIYPYPINRSYHLTKNNTFKIYRIIWFLLLFSIPVALLVMLITFIITFLFYVTFPAHRYLLILFVPTVLYISHALLLPLWQVVKAVVFHHLSQKDNQRSIW